MQTRFGRSLPAEVKQTARPDPPRKADEVILLLAEIARVIVLPAAQPADERLRAERRDQRPINRAVLRFAGSGYQRVAPLEFRT